MITALTSDQQAHLPIFRREWLDIGLSTAPADRQRAEIAIAEMYAEIEKPGPRVVWFDSPATMYLGRFLMDRLHEKSLWASLRASLWASLWASLGDSLGDSLRDSLGDSLGDSLWDSYWGQHEAYWIAFYRFCRDDLGVQYDPRRSRQLDLWADLAQSCGWWMPFENFVLASERPIKQSIDENERLHATDGPAMLFRDGWAVYAVHGVRVVDEHDWIDDRSKLTAARVLSEPNAEVRRVMLEMFGVTRFMQDADPEVLDTDTDGGGQPRRLLRIRQDGDEDLVVADVTCPSTGHRYFLRVPPDMRRAHDAVAWTYGCEPARYAPVVEA